MKNIFKIYARDMKRTFTNWACIIMVIVLLGIPSLYSLTNIAASWDPYANTDGIKIAVVNKDKGSTYKDQEFHLGDTLVEKLKETSKMNWCFVDEEEAENGLKYERYYASLVIPEDFSENAISFMQEKITKPKLIYTVNEKTNAIAPKLTDAGVSSAQKIINHEITKTVSGVGFKILNEIGVQVDGKRDDLQYVIDKICEIDEELPELEKVIDDALAGTKSLSDVTQKTNDLLPQVSDLLGTSSEFVDNSEEMAKNIQTNVKTINPQISSSLDSLHTLVDDTYVMSSNLENDIAPEAAKKFLTIVSETSQAGKVSVSGTKDMLTDVREFLKKIADFKFPQPNLSDKVSGEKLKETLKKIEDRREKFEKERDKINNQILGRIDSMLEKLDSADELLGRIYDKAQTGLQKIENGEAPALQLLTDINSLLKEADDLTGNLLTFYNNELSPDVDEAGDSIINILDTVSDVVGIANDALPDLQTILGDGQDVITLTNSTLSEFKSDKFQEIKDKIHETAESLKEKEESGKFDEIIDLFTNNWEAQTDIITNVLDVENNRLFSWPDYGSSSTPFYLVLAIWVGALIASALVLLHVEPLEEGVELKQYEIYFGRMLTFLTFTIPGALIATAGAIWGLGVYCVHPVLMLCFAAFLSLVFTAIIYTAGSLLDDVGKAMIVVIMVLQIAGTNGTFPIEVNPLLFQYIYKFLPFTYGISGMRQIQAGLNVSVLSKDISVLCIYLVVSLVIGTLIKKLVKPFIDYIIGMLKKSEILRE